MLLLLKNSDLLFFFSVDELFFFGLMYDIYKLVPRLKDMDDKNF